MTGHVLIIDDDEALGQALKDGLVARGFDAEAVTSPDIALALIDKGAVEAVISDVRMPRITGIELCERIRARAPGIPIVLMTAFGELDTAVAAIRAGAYDFLTKPVKLDVLSHAASRAVEHYRLVEEVKRLRVAVLKTSDTGIIGTSPAMKDVLDIIERISNTNVSVLIAGESGTGKEMLARAIHQTSPRSKHPFIAVNCAALPDTLLESELFGFIKGAFTDARENRKGLVRDADGGTLLLDEIGDMPLSLQPKLLRLLQERRVRPLGSSAELPVDVRIIAATHRDLEELVEQQRFREDLFFRLNVVHIEVPPLRARRADILPLAQGFLKECARRQDRSVSEISPEAARALLDYSWPGNVRELQNCIEAAVALSRFSAIALEDLPKRIRTAPAPEAFAIPTDDPSTLPSMEEVERQYMRKVLEAVGGNKAQAARILGIERKTLYRKLERFGLGGNEG